MAIGMTSAMDREFYEGTDCSRRHNRRKDTAEAVLAGMHRASQLSVARELVTKESQVGLNNELDRELSWLTANTAQLKELLRAGGAADGEVSVKDHELVKAAEKVISEASKARESPEGI